MATVSFPDALNVALPVTADRTADLVDRLGELIEERQLRPGDRLPPIRELATSFGVKAGAIRDALFDAQGKGIVKVMPRAGAFVQAVDDPPVPSSAHDRSVTGLGRLFEAADRNLFHVLDAREIIELETVTRVARKRQLQDLFPLRRILERMAPIPVDSRCANYTRLDIRFHLEIARLADNAVLATVLASLLEELEPHLLGVSWSPERRGRTDESHALLYSSLVDGDVEAARDRMRAHVRDAYESLLDEVRRPPMAPESNGGS